MNGCMAPTETDGGRNQRNTKYTFHAVDIPVNIPEVKVKGAVEMK